jgi:hypothetical protein
MTSSNNKKSRINCLAGLALGIAVGVAIGAGIDNIGAGIGIGVALGLVFAESMKTIKDRSKSNTNTADQAKRK